MGYEISKKKPGLEFKHLNKIAYGIYLAWEFFFLYNYGRDLLF